MTVHKITGATLPMERPVGQPDPRPGFKESFQTSLNQVNNLQAQAHTAMEDLAVGRSGNLHETMIAVQKAEISFKMLAQVRNKVMSAYQEVMRMQV
jgi:flagellar hook-basal body complex protein FliE